MIWCVKNTRVLIYKSETVHLVTTISNKTCKTTFRIRQISKSTHAYFKIPYIYLAPKNFLLVSSKLPANKAQSAKYTHGMLFGAIFVYKMFSKKQAFTRIRHPELFY